MRLTGRGGGTYASSSCMDKFTTKGNILAGPRHRSMIAAGELVIAPGLRHDLDAARLNRVQATASRSRSDWIIEERMT